MKRIPLRLIDDSPFNSRVIYGEKEVSTLASSIEKVGLLCPISVRAVGERYQIVYGHRRIRAARILGWEAIDAEIKEFNDKQMMCASLVENIERADLCDFEKANSFRQLHDKFKVTCAEIGDLVGYSESHINNFIRMTELLTRILWSILLKLKKILKKSRSITLGCFSQSGH